MAAEKIYWINHDGGSIDLTDNIVYRALDGVDGRWMPPFEIITNEVYKVPGDYVRARKTKSREITLPIAVFGTCDTDLVKKLRILTDAFDPTQGDGKLKVVTSEGGTLLMNCHYIDGMSFPENTDTGGCTWRKFVAIFQAHDPFWWDPNENQVTFYGWYTRYAQSVKNQGDVETWPIWTLGGPATAFRVYNLTTSLGFEIAGMSNLLSQYDTVYVDTRRGKVNININHNLNTFSHLTTVSNLFPLVPGVNRIFVEIDGGDNTDYTNLISCRWIDRYYGV